MLPVDFALSRSGLTASEKLVLVAICRKLGTKKAGEAIRISPKDMCDLLEMPEATMKIALRELKNHNLISWEKVFHKGRAMLSMVVHVVHPEEEEARLRRDDKQLSLSLHRFGLLFGLHPRALHKEECWALYSALNADENLYFKILNDMELRIVGEWNGSVPPTFAEYLEAKPWETQLALAKDMLPVLPSAARGTRLRADWKLPKEWGEWAMQEGCTAQEVLEEADYFRDYWISRADRLAVKLDWQATWRNWIRKNKKPAHKKTFAEQTKNFKEEQGKEKFKHLASADSDYLKLWGFTSEPKG